MSALEIHNNLVSLPTESVTVEDNPASSDFRSQLLKFATILVVIVVVTIGVKFVIPKIK